MPSSKDDSTRAGGRAVPGALTLKELQTLVTNGAVDTVLLADLLANAGEWTPTFPGYRPSITPQASSQDNPSRRHAPPTVAHWVNTSITSRQ